MLFRSPLGARRPPTIEGLREGESFGTLEFRLDLGGAVAAFVRDVVEEDNPLYRGADAVCHPAYWLAQANEVFMCNIALGMWIHTASEIQHLALIVFVVMLGVVPLFGALVARVRRNWLVPVVYAFFITHLLAFAYFSAVANQPSGRDFLTLAGPGFRDFTRIAASDPTVWRDILLVNRDEVLSQLAYTRQALSVLEHAMSEGDGAKLHELIEAVRRARSDWRMASETD